MVNACESVIKTVIREQAKVIDITPEPKRATGIGRRFPCTSSWSKVSLGRQQEPNPTLLSKRNVETLYFSPAKEKVNRKEGLWKCRIGMSEKANAIL